MYSLFETTVTSISQRILDDRSGLSLLLLPISLSVSDQFKIIRLGQSNFFSPRLLKILGANKDFASSHIKYFNSLNKVVLLLLFVPAFDLSVIKPSVKENFS